MEDRVASESRRFMWRNFIVVMIFSGWRLEVGGGFGVLLVDFIMIFGLLHTEELVPRVAGKIFALCHFHGEPTSITIDAKN